LASSNAFQLATTGVSQSAAVAAQPSLDETIGAMKTTTLNEWIKGADADPVKMALVYAAGEAQQQMSRSKTLNAVCIPSEVVFTADQYLSLLKVQAAIGAPDGNQKADTLFSAMFAGLQRTFPCPK
jgi:deoxyribose-phosphate aldolase